MSYHATMDSPLGEILLEADTAGLSGLYFTDQRDCPKVPGLEAAEHVVSRPSAGVRSGLQTRLCKVVPADSALEGELFPTTVTALAVNHSAVLQLLENDTPSDVLAILEQTRLELDEYWRGERQTFDIPLAPRGTAFQRQIWQALLDVTCGTTCSYGQLGQQAGLGAGHGRAVGTAVGSNPISIIIPCHRILAGNGSLNGYGGGLDRKIHLLEIEGFRIHA